MAERLDINANMNIVIENNIVESDILPMNKAEMWRSIKIKRDAEIKGAVMGLNLVVEAGQAVFHKSVFIKEDISIHVSRKNTRNIFMGNVQAEKTILIQNAYLPQDSYTVVYGDIYSHFVTLKNAFVYGNIFCDKLILENSVVLGGVFCSGGIKAKESVVGTFTAQNIQIENHLFIIHKSMASALPFEANGKLKLILLAKDNPDRKIAYGIDIYESDFIQTEETQEEFEEETEDESETVAQAADGSEEPVNDETDAETQTDDEDGAIAELEDAAQEQAQEDEIKPESETQADRERDTTDKAQEYRKISIGLGMRILNIQKFTDLFTDSIQILKQKYAISHLPKESRSLKDEIAWEKALLDVSHHLADLKTNDTFSAEINEFDDDDFDDEDLSSSDEADGDSVDHEAAEALSGEANAPDPPKA